MQKSCARHSHQLSLAISGRVLGTPGNEALGRRALSELSSPDFRAVSSQRGFFLGDLISTTSPSPAPTPQHQPRALPRVGSPPTITPKDQREDFRLKNLEVRRVPQPTRGPAVRLPARPAKSLTDVRSPFSPPRPSILVAFASSPFPYPARSVAHSCAWFLIVTVPRPDPHPLAHNRVLPSFLAARPFDRPPSLPSFAPARLCLSLLSWLLQWSQVRGAFFSLTCPTANVRGGRASDRRRAEWRRGNQQQPHRS